MTSGGRYQPLFTRLRHEDASEVTLSFAEIEALIRGKLPASARTARAWWSNRASGTQAAAWMQAKYHVAEVNLATERVLFRKQRAEYHLQRTAAGIIWNSEAIKALRVHMDLNQTAFADELGVRQQTVSEWEKGVYAPTRATGKHLTRVAETMGFIYPSGAQFDQKTV